MLRPTARCPRCSTLGSMTGWAPLSDDRNRQALLLASFGNTHRSACTRCKAVEQRSLGVTYAHGTGFARVAA